MSAKTTPFIRLALALTVLLTVACGESLTDPSPVDDPPDDENPEVPASPPANIPAFASTLPDWSAFSPPLEPADGPVGEPVEGEEAEMIDGTGYICTTTPYSLTQTPEKITTLNPDVEVLWVGALLQGDGYVNGIGSLAELPIRQRGPVTLTIDLLTEGNTEIVDDPTVATVNQAIGKLVSEAQAAGHQAGSNIFYTSETTHSMDQALLKVGASAKYAGSSIKASLSAEMSHERRTVTAYYIQRMFTVSMVLPQNPADVFSDAFTQEMLEAETASGRMGPDNPPVYVSSVTYGRILMFSFSSESTLAKINATLSALYDGGSYGGGAELEADLQSVLDQAKIQVVTVGGDADQALGLIRSNDLGAFFTEDAPLTTAKPISYTIRNLADNAIAAVSETTSYDLKECTPTPPTGAKFQITLSGITATAVNDGLLEGPNTAELYYEIQVTDDVNGPQIATKHHPTLIEPYKTSLTEGEFFAFPNVTPITVTIHFDGDDEVRVHGSVTEWDAAPNPHEPFPFTAKYAWPGTPLTAGAKGHNVTDGKGNTFRIHWNVVKLEDVYD